MTLEFVLPEINTQNKKIRELIISILADNWPLTIKKMHNKIKKEYSLSVSYQAIHKAINELKEKGIVEKTKKEYKLSIEWIKKLKEFSERLERNYKKGMSYENFNNITFDTIWELYLFFIDAIRKNIFKINDRTICFIGHSVWNPQIGSEREQNAYYEIIKKYNIFMAIGKDNALNRIWKSFWEDFGVKVSLGKIPFHPDVDTFIIGDFIIQIFYPGEAVKRESELMNKVKKISDIKPQNINKVYFTNYGKIHLNIIENKELALSMKKRVRVLFD